ncbi:MAG: polysaccharide biosynthesis/export family protein [Hyphomicrobiaceae bacterium]
MSQRRSTAPPFAALLLVAITAAACSDGNAVGPSLPRSALAERDLRSYRLGAGDKVRLTVFGETELSGTFEINSLGRISLPLAGDVEAAGLDANGLRDVATRRLSDGYLKSPKITVEVVGYRPIYVHGEVRSGGEFPYKIGLRLRDAIALAGGYTYRANQGYVVLSRPGVALDARVSMPTDMIIMPGDNIRVPERYF